MIAEELGQALERAARALEADDPLAAADAMAEVQRLCEETPASRVRLDAQSLERLRTLQERCERGARSVQDRLTREFEAASSARRAAAAYGDR